MKGGVEQVSSSIITAMSSQAFTVVAVLYPNKGKTDEVWIATPSSANPANAYSKVVALLNEVAEYVHTKEPGTLQYEINRSLRPSKDGLEEIVMIERSISPFVADASAFH